MNERIETVYYPSQIEDDAVIRTAVTLEIDGDTIYTHNESVWKGYQCIGSIFGWKSTDAPAEYQTASLEAIEGLKQILKDEYGMEFPEDTPTPDIVPPVAEEVGNE